MSCDRMTDWPPLLIHVTDRTSLLCIAPVCKMGSYKPVMLCFAAFAALLQLSYGFTPPTAHTIGQPWPKPANMTQTADVQALSMDTFQFMVTGNNCDLLRGALNRYFKIIFYTGRDGQDSTLRFRPRPSYGANLLPSLSVNVKSACLDTADKRLMPSLDMDESYTLSVKTGSAELTANAIWGALRGLETFSQIVFQDATGLFQVKNTEITDAPRFRHRGVLLDASRHFLAKETIFSALEAMAYNKINVFHWHIVDDQAFPYQSRDFPQLSQKGAFDPNTHVYTQEDVHEVTEFARQRGIRVVAEFDTPGHTQSWGKAMPGFLTQCCDKSGHFNGNYGPVDPTHSDIYTFLTKFVKELTEVFPDHYLHLGGDEVHFECWQSNPNITKFMQAQGFGTDYSKLENYYEQKLLDIMNSYNAGYIVWQEVFDNKIKIRPDTVVHAWKGDWKAEMAAITAQKFRALLSTPWYLDLISYGADWHNYYMVEPLAFNGTEIQKALVMGGEACLWGEGTDGTNMQSRLWPRASAVAERLWSPANVNDVNEAEGRIEEHRCRMVRRGVPAEPPSGPNYCKYEQRPAPNPLWF